MPTPAVSKFRSAWDIAALLDRCQHRLISLACNRLLLSQIDAINSWLLTAALIFTVDLKPKGHFGLVTTLANGSRLVHATERCYWFLTLWPVFC